MSFNFTSHPPTFRQATAASRKERIKERLSSAACRTHLLFYTSTPSTPSTSPSRPVRVRDPQIVAAAQDGLLRLRSAERQPLDLITTFDDGRREFARGHKFIFRFGRQEDRRERRRRGSVPAWSGSGTLTRIVAVAAPLLRLKRLGALCHPFDQPVKGSASRTTSVVSFHHQR